ncbi:putative ankyrin repeat protein [Trichoplax sp. H2]|nr:putative ankyrin repeat protein [Trichoplax sp. H2]|eukprot:RDD47645.1 putative ankyrin repeat protein [Trichoplax sp. H2]
MLQGTRTSSGTLTMNNRARTLSATLNTNNRKLGQQNAGDVVYHAAKTKNEQLLAQLKKNIDAPLTNEDRIRFKESSTFQSIHDGDANTLRLLLKYGANPNYCNTWLCTPVHRAALIGSVEMLKMLYEANGDLNSLVDIKCSPLHYAARRKESIAVEWLIKNKVDINQRDDRGRCAIHHAIEIGMVEPLKVLLKYGARTDIANNENKVPILYAIAHDRGDCLKVLLKHCKDINQCYDNFGTALHYAVRCKKPRCVEVLLQFNVDIYAINKANETSIDVAAKVNSVTIQEILRLTIEKKLNGDDNKISSEIESIAKKLSTLTVQVNNLENSIDDKISTGICYYSASLDSFSNLIDDLTIENKRRDEDIDIVSQTQDSMSKYMQDLSQNTKNYIEQSTSNFEMAHNDLLSQVDNFNRKQAVIAKKLESTCSEYGKLRDDVQDKSLELVAEQQIHREHIERLQGGVQALTESLKQVFEDLQQLQQQRQLEWSSELMTLGRNPKIHDPDRIQNERIQGTLNSISDNSKMMSEAIKLLKDEQQRLSDHQKFNDRNQHTNNNNDNTKSFILIIVVGILISMLLQVWQNMIRK